MAGRSDLCALPVPVAGATSRRQGARTPPASPELHNANDDEPSHLRDERVSHTRLPIQNDAPALPSPAAVPEPALLRQAAGDHGDDNTREQPASSESPKLGRRWRSPLSTAERSAMPASGEGETRSVYVVQRHFRLVRRGYDPAEVDRHLQVVSSMRSEPEREIAAQSGDELERVAGDFRPRRRTVNDPTAAMAQPDADEPARLRAARSAVEREPDRVRPVRPPAGPVTERPTTDRTLVRAARRSSCGKRPAGEDNPEPRGESKAGSHEPTIHRINKLIAVILDTPVPQAHGRGTVHWHGPA